MKPARGRERERCVQPQAEEVLGAEEGSERADQGALEKWSKSSRTPGDGLQSAPGVLLGLPHRGRGQGLHTTSFPGLKLLAPSRGPAYSQYSDSVYQIDANNLTQQGGQGISTTENRNRYLLLGLEHVPGTVPNTLHTLFHVIFPEP